MALASAAAGQSRVAVTGRVMEVNGQAEVPRGLFGVHADVKLEPERAADWGIDAFRQIHFVPGSGLVALDKEGNLRAPFKDMPVVIDCQGDRFHPAVVLTNPDYEEHFRKIGRQYAQRCKDLSWKGYAEFWNEPYLNWAERSRRNYDPKFYDATRAADDGPVTIKGWDRPLKYLRWRRLWAQDEAGKIQHLVPVPKGARPGDKFTYKLGYYFTDNREQTYTVVEKWDVYDPTQVSFWSGKQNYDFYMWMFLPWAKAVKETNPDVTVLGGWDFHIHTEGWKAWEMLFRPMIDESIQWLDGVTEHHYGSDTRATAGTYEVVVGYAIGEHGKRLKCYNTETAGCVDPAVPGNRHGNATPYGAYNYGLRDIVELVYRCPDKAGSRIAHGSLAPGWGGGGDEFLFKLLKDLRGRLIHAASDDLNVWPAACLNGDRLVVVLFNDHPSDRTVNVTIDAPAACTLGGGGKTWVEPVSEKGPLQFRQEKLQGKLEEKLAAAGRRFEGQVAIRQKSGVKLVFPLTGRPGARCELQRRQFFAKAANAANAAKGAKGVLQKVSPGQTVSLNVALPADLLASAESAVMRLVLEGARDGQASIRLNGLPVRLPAYEWITDVPVDRKALKAENVLVLEAAGSGYQVDAASIILDLPASAR